MRYWWLLAIIIGVALGLAMQWTTIKAAYDDQGLLTALAFLFGASLMTIPLMFLAAGSAFAPLPPKV